MHAAFGCEQRRPKEAACGFRHLGRIVANHGKKSLKIEPPGNNGSLAVDSCPCILGSKFRYWRNLWPRLAIRVIAVSTPVVQGIRLSRDKATMFALLVASSETVWRTREETVAWLR